MNTLILQKRARELGQFVQKANRKLFEFEMLQSEWEYKNGKGKTYKSAAHLVRSVKSKLK